jgi:hypothetical protein
MHKMKNDSRMAAVSTVSPIVGVIGVFSPFVQPRKLGIDLNNMEVSSSGFGYFVDYGLFNNNVPTYLVSGFRKARGPLSISNRISLLWEH